MATKLHKNAIITGCINSFCLACDTYLKCEEDAALHIEKHVHKKNLNSILYFEKYKGDHIRKVKRRYFCEFCNILLATATKVCIHVADAKHIDNKGTLLLKVVANGVIAYDDILINDRAWHSLTEDTCAICNTEYNNEDIHKSSPSHLLNLTLNKVEFGANKSIYRRIDDSTFQCITCNIVLALNTIDNHFNDSDHQNNYIKCHIAVSTNGFTDDQKNEENINSKQTNANDKENKSQTIHADAAALTKNDDTIKNCDQLKVNKVDDILKDTEQLRLHKVGISNKNTEKINLNSENTIADKEANKSKILASVLEFQKCEVNINFEIETVFCKKCFISVNFEFDEIEKHVAEHKNTEKSPSYPSEVNPNYNKTSLRIKRQIPQYSENPCNNALQYKTDVDQNHNDINSQNNEEEMETIFINLSSDDESDDNESSDGDLKGEDEEKTENLIDFAKQNDITYNATNKNSFCRVCKVRLPSSFRSIKEHVQGVPHKSRVACEASTSKNKNRIPKKPSKQFINNAISVENFFHQDTVVNEKYCLTTLSFHMISKHGSRLRCQVCQVSIIDEDMENHVETYSHEKAMTETPVVTLYDSEFVREIRSGLYHCGYCNLILGSWEDFRSHLKCSEHQAQKDTAQLRLRRHMPSIIEHKRERDMQFFRMMMFGHMRNRFFD